MAYYGDQAVALPNLTQGPASTFFDTQRLLDTQQNRADQLAEKKKMDDYRSANMLQEEFKNQQYQTPLPDINDYINNGLNKGMQDILAMKQANPAMSYTDMLGQVRKTIAPLADLSQRVKTINANNKASLDQVKKDYPDVDENQLEQMATRNAFYTTDKNGNPVLKPFNQINDSKNYIADVLQNNPQDVLKGISGLQSHVYSFHPQTFSASTGDEFQGVKQKSKWEAKMSPFSELVKDKEGNVVGSQVKSESQSIGNGKSIQVLPQEAMDVLMSDKKSALVVNAAYKQFLAKNNLPIPQESIEGQIIKRKIARDLLNNMNLQSFQTTKDETKNAAATRVEFGFNPYGKIPGPEDEYKVNAVQALGHILNNDPNYLQGNKTVVGGQNVIDVTSALPGGGLKHGRGDLDKYEGVYYNPEKRSLIVESQPPSIDGKKQPLEQKEIAEPDIEKFMYKIAAANNVPPSEVPKILQQMGYQNGHFISSGAAPKVTPDNVINGDMDQLPKFEKDGGVGKLDSFEGSVINGKTVKSIGTDYSPFNSTNYKITTVDHEGKEDTIKFKSKKEVSDYLRTGTEPGKPKQQQTNAPKFPLPAGQAMTRKQNGYTYTWNENTGQYE